MRKKIIITGLTCVFLLLTGICYSCAYSNKASSVLVSSGSIDNGTKEEVTIPAGNSSVTITPTAMNSLDSNPISETSQDNPQDQKVEYVYAHICGAVVKPGVYRAESGARLYEFLNLAGGLTKKAAGDYINQAQPVVDGQRIYIPNQEEIEALSLEEVIAGGSDIIEADKSNSGSSDTSSSGSALININTANAEELMSISGIGEAKANSILAYREKNGKFNSIEELMNIPGIKEGLFNQISYMIVAN